MTYFFNCPRCGNHENFERADSLGWILIWILLNFTGIGLFIHPSHLNRWHCLDCGHIFRQPRIPPTAVSMVCLFTAATTIVLALIGLFSMAYPTEAKNTVGPEVAAWLRKALVDRGGTMAYALAAGVLLVLLLCAAISWISNYRHRWAIWRQLQSCVPKAGSRNPVGNQAISAAPGQQQRE